MTATISRAALLVDVQVALNQELNDDDHPPGASLLTQWAELAHQAVSEKPSEVTLRLVDEAEMVELNEGFRGKLGSTNVLSFPADDQFDHVLEGELALLGDIVICHQVIAREAVEQNKTIMNHYAHMVTHGVLHLHGFDHLDDAAAEEMEALEADILDNSGIPNPYN